MQETAEYTATTMENTEDVVAETLPETTPEIETETAELSETLSESVEQTQEKGKVPFLEKISAFFDRNFVPILTWIIVLGLYFFMSWVYKVYPFSKNYTAASYDYSAQICPFFEHIFDVLKGKSSLTYSYSIMGGADVTGMFLYTFVSPFSLLFLVCGEGNAVYAATFVVGFKVATIGLSGAWFARKLFKNIPDYLCVVIGLLYAFCGYAFVASTFIAWLDLLIYLPFCVGAFCRFVKTGSFWLFSVLVACCIYAHFSIASFALFIVFPALIAYALFCVEKENRYKFITRLCLAFVLAVLIALPILVPALVAFLRSSRGGGLFDRIWYGFDTETWKFTNKIPGQSQTYTQRYEEYFFKKISYIIADAAFVALTVAWFFRNGLEKPMAKFMLTAGILTLIPVVVDESMLLLNMGSYFSYSLRFGFLNALYFMGGACLCLDELCYKKDRAYDGGLLCVNTTETDVAGVEDVACVTEEMGQNPAPVSQSSEETKVEKVARTVISKTKITLWKAVIIGIGAIAIAAMALLGFFSWFINSDTPSGNNFYSKYKHLDIVYNLRNTPGSYAHSLGGAELIIIPFFIVCLLLLLGGWLISGKKVSVRILSQILTVLLSVQTVFNCGLMVEGNRSTQHNALEEYKQMSAVIAEQDDGYYRTQDYGRMYYKDGNIRLENVWSDCVSFSGDTNSFSVFSSIIDADNYATRALFAYQGGDASFKGQNDYRWTYRSDYFASCFMGYKYIYLPNNMPKGKEEIHTKTIFEKKYVNTKDGNLPREYMSKVMVDNAHVHSSNWKFAYENNGVFPLGYRVSGEPYKFVKSNVENNPYNRRDNLDALYKFLRGKPLAADQKGEQSSGEYISLEAVWELSEYLHTKAADVEVGAGEITATVTAEEDGEYLFLNFVASKGYTVTVNGKKAELVDNDLNFLMVELEEGENVVHFTYASPYVKYSGASLIAALMAAAVVILLLKKTKIFDKCAPVIAWTGIALGVALVAFFMIYPTGIFVAKLAGLLRLKL